MIKLFFAPVNVVVKALLNTIVNRVVNNTSFPGTLGDNMTAFINAVLDVNLGLVISIVFTVCFVFRLF